MSLNFYKMKEADSPNDLSAIDIRRAFDKAASDYDRYAVLQRAVADHLLETLELFTIKPGIVVDLGAGTGYCTNPLRSRFPKSKLILCDISLQMLRVAKSKSRYWRRAPRYVNADINELPFADNSVDVLFSSLAFQWCRDLDKLFAECKRSLKPDGLMIFSSLGPDTLRELRSSFAAADNTPHVHDFIDMHDVGDALVRAGFTAPVLQTDRITMTYDTMMEVMRDLRGIGAVNQSQQRRRSLSSRQVFNLAQAHYESYREQGLLPATYEVVYAHAFSPTPHDPAQDGSQVASFPLHQLQRRDKS